MKIILLLFFLINTTIYADICICSYPTEDAKYGSATEGEIGFYRLGCLIWRTTQRGCHHKKSFNINEPLDDYIAKNQSGNEILRLGFVGHWSNSWQLVKYLENEIYPTIERHNISVEIDNTACSALNNPKQVEKSIRGYSFPDNRYLKVTGSQTTSTGMWDKTLLIFRKADLTATIDSRTETIQYPKCKDHIGMRCHSKQIEGTGICINKKKQKETIYCVSKLEKYINKKLFNRWVYEKDVYKYQTKD